VQGFRPIESSVRDQGCAHSWPAALGLEIEIVFGREGWLGTRTITITAVGEIQAGSTVSTVSRVSDNGLGAGLNHP